MMYKDRSEVNHRNDSDFLQVLHEEAEWLKRYHVDHEDKKMLKELFLPEDEISGDIYLGIEGLVIRNIKTQCYYLPRITQIYIFSICSKILKLLSSRGEQ